MRTTEERLREDLEQIRDERGTHRNTATRIGQALLALLDLILSKADNLPFLRRDVDDTAEGRVGFLQGLWVKAQNLFGISADGDATVRSLKATGTGNSTTTDASGQTKGLGLEVTESGVIGGLLRVAQNILTRTIQSIGFSGGDSMFGTGWQLTDDDGSDSSRLVVDKLFVRKKAVFNEVEVRKMVAIGGNYVFSPAASIIEEVDYIKMAPVPGETDLYTETVLGYEYLSVPWVLRLVPLSLRNKLLSRRKLFRTAMTDEDWAQVSIYRCWLKADDGTTRTINTWQTGMLARCQTYDVAASPDGTHTGEAGSTATQSKYYWRAVTAKGENVTRQTYTKLTKVLDDGLGHHYIDLANTSPYYDTGSDRPSAGDSIACFGNYLNQELSNLITIETVGSEAPCIRELLGVGYDDGIVPRWSLEGCERTRISPVAGNRFVAPSFEIETTGGTTEKLYNVVEKGTAVDFRPNTPYITTGRVGDILLVTYASWTATGTHLLRCTAAGGSHGGEITLPVYESLSASLGDGYVLDVDGHIHVATQTGWEDRGLVDEAKSSLKVTMDGISAQVAGKASTSDLTLAEASIKAYVKNELRTVGIEIDGDDDRIDLIAGKVNFKRTENGQLVTNPNVSIDANTGILSAVGLQAVNGNFSGSVTALRLLRPACQWYGMLNYYNFNNDDNLGQWFYIINLSRFTDIVEAEGGTVPDTFTGDYVSFREIVSWGYIQDLSSFTGDLVSDYGQYGAYCCIPCSYNSQMLYVRGNGFVTQSTSGGQTVTTVNAALPRPEDFPGMVVHVENLLPSDSIQVVAAPIDNNFLLNGLALMGIESPSVQGNVAINAGDSRDFMSVSRTVNNATTWYWLSL